MTHSVRISFKPATMNAAGSAPSFAKRPQSSFSSLLASQSNNPAMKGKSWLASPKGAIRGGANTWNFDSEEQAECSNPRSSLKTSWSQSESGERTDAGLTYQKTANTPSNAETEMDTSAVESAATKTANARRRQEVSSAEAKSKSTGDPAKAIGGNEFVTPQQPANAEQLDLSNNPESSSAITVDGAGAHEYQAAGANNSDLGVVGEQLHGANGVQPSNFVEALAESGNVDANTTQLDSLVEAAALTGAADIQTAATISLDADPNVMPSNDSGSSPRQEMVDISKPSLTGSTASHAKASTAMNKEAKGTASDAAPSSNNLSDSASRFQRDLTGSFQSKDSQVVADGGRSAQPIPTLAPAADVQANSNAKPEIANETLLAHMGVNLQHDDLGSAGSTVIQGMSLARLTRHLGGSEMCVSMRSQEFGDINIRTSYSQRQVEAQISVNHDELSALLSDHVLSVQHKLGEDLGLPMMIDVSNTSGSLGGREGHASQQGFNSQHPSGTGSTEQTAAGELAAVSSSSTAYQDGRLHISA